MTPADLRAIRERLGLTQAELAERIGVTDRSMRRYESGEHSISRPIAMLIESIRPRRRKQQQKAKQGR
jgi:transcriptional regulator with XRE-family HTH domain